jgi:hypothetical protein
MSKLTSFKDVIALWPSYAQLASDLGLEAERRRGSEMVRKWAERNWVDVKWWPLLMRTTTGREAGLNPELLTKIASRRYPAKP